MRYFKLYFTCLKRSIISRLEYKKDTIISMFSFFISNICSILSIYFILQTIPTLNGWGIAEIGFLYGFSMLPVALDHLFSDDLWMVAYHKVRNGELDRCFLRPVPVLFQVIAETFQPEGFGEMLVGIVMIAICGNLINITWSFNMIFMLIIATIFGGLIITSIKIICASFAFRFKRSGQLLQIVYGLIQYTRYPISIYPKFLKGILMFVFPFALVISLPIEALVFNSYSPYVLSLLIIGVSVLFLIISILIWNFNIKKYESSGS